MKVVQFVVENKAFFAALLGLIISEYMSLNPNSKANGILEFLMGLIKKAQPAAAVEAPKA